MLTKRAQNNLEEMFPHRASPLAQTDPELAALFVNLAFDEVLGDKAIDRRTRVMAQLAALIAVQGLTEFKVLLGGALTIGVTPVEVKEVVYQAVPYVGFGKAIDFIHAVNAALTERGVALPLSDQSTTTRDTRASRGFAVQAEVIGLERASGMKASMPADQAHIADLLAANCFGDHVARGCIDLRTRELLTLSMLAAQGGCDAQVRGHVAGNLNVGNDRATLIELVTLLLPFIGYPRALNALAAINEIAKD